MYQYALFCDLDRTLLPNGEAPESPRARDMLARLCARDELALIYVSGRDLSLLEQAISDYQLPPPVYAVCDVGTSIYRYRQHADWQSVDDWQAHIATDFKGIHAGDLHPLLADLPRLELQEPDRQSRFKLSYYTPLLEDRAPLLAEIRRRLAAAGVRSELIWSVDEAADCGLLDILPASATKLHAVEYLMQLLGLPAEQCVFAGDSGNDLPVVSSGRIRSVLVANAHPEVSAEARRKLLAAGKADMLYLASGRNQDHNGNYSAGVVEGFVYFHPEAGDWLSS